MPDPITISQINFNGSTFVLKDAVARSAIESLNSFEYVMCTNAGDTPYGITWDNVTGTLVASAATKNVIRLVPSGHQDEDSYDEYITIQNSNEFAWEKIGSTHVDLSPYLRSDDASDLYALRNNTVITGSLSMGRAAGSIVGPGSVALGNMTKAIVAYSHAEGDRTTASGYTAHAEGFGGKYTDAGNNEITPGAFGNSDHSEGYQTLANSGDYGVAAHSEGTKTKATGDAAHAEGKESSATNTAAHVEGYRNTASGQYSHAEGYGTRANSSNSHAEGQNTLSSGMGSHAEGGWSEATNQYSHAEGFHTSTASSYSHAEGNYTRATAPSAHAEGEHTLASGTASHAEGVAPTNHSNTRTITIGNDSYSFSYAASGAYSHTEGAYNVASGSYSHAEGTYTIARDPGSHSEGGYSVAFGPMSHAEGQYTRALDDQTHAEGLYTVASNDSAHAEGSRTTASGVASHAEGSDTEASGYYSHAEGYGGTYTNDDHDDITSGAYSEADHSEGYQTLANSRADGYSGYGAHAEGYRTIASAIGAHAEGYQTTASQQAAHSEGYKSVASGSNSHAEGAVATASGPQSHAEGAATTASGGQSHAEGASTTASGNQSHAEGTSTSASGSMAHAEGYHTIASGSMVHAEGEYTTASGLAAHAEGEYTEASGYFSHAEGLYTVADASSMHAMGTYNVGSNVIYPQWVSGTSYAVGDKVIYYNVGYECIEANSDSQFNYSKWQKLPSTGDTAFVIGNGADGVRSNAMTVKWTGDAHFMGDIYTGANNDGTGGNKLVTSADIHQIPSGGTSGQVLAKSSSTDYDVEWVNQTGGGNANIDDTAGSGDTDKVWSADKTFGEISDVKKIEGYVDANWESGGMYDASGIEYAADARSRTGFIPVSSGEKIMFLTDASYNNSFTVFEFASNETTASGTNERLNVFSETYNRWITFTNTSVNYVRVTQLVTVDEAKAHVFVLRETAEDKRIEEKTASAMDAAVVAMPYKKALVFSRYGLDRTTGNPNTSDKRIHSSFVRVSKGDVLRVPDGYKYFVFYYTTSGYASNTYDALGARWLTGEYTFTSSGFVSINVSFEEDATFTSTTCQALNGKCFIYTNYIQNIGGVLFEPGHIDANLNYWLPAGNDYVFNTWLNATLLTTRWRTAKITLFRKGTTVSIASGYRFYIFKYPSGNLGATATTTQWYTGSYVFEEDTYARLVLDLVTGTAAYTTWPALNRILFITGNEEKPVSEYNADMDQAIVWASGYNTYVSGDSAAATGKKNNFCFSTITDVHGSGDAFSRFIDYSNEKSAYLDAVICCGDMVPVEPTQSISWFGENLVRSVRPFLFEVGNHDVGQTNLSGITQETARTNYYTDIISKGFLAASDFEGTGRCSWFKDFSSYKIRIIAPFEYGNCYEAESGVTNKCARRWLDSNTMQWFADTLYSTPAGYSVIILLHQTSSGNMTFVENNPFCITKETSYAYGHWSDLFMNLIDGNPIEDLVNAFMTSTNFSHTYGCLSWTGLSLTASVAKDFSQRTENGTFVGYFCGHTHANYVFRSATYPNQICIGLPTGSDNLYQRKYGDILYSSSSRNRDNFCIVGIDTSAKKINLVKIGGQLTTDMRERWYTSISYGVGE